MSKLLDRFRYFKQKGETFANGHGQVYNNNRDWEDSYRQRMAVRQNCPLSTHGVNCTGSCSWKNLRQKRSRYLGSPADRLSARTRPDLPNHEPHAAARAAPATPGISTAPTA
ncbi:hypothetical protein MJ588_15570 [Klebsiella pneumoniae]|nr:hypothetical protein MJ588_15570 [Klebsiella pneumoniae]